MAKITPFEVYEHPLPDVIGTELNEQTVQMELDYGKHELRRWFFDGIGIHHSKTSFNDHYWFSRQNPDGIVSLSFNLQGSYDIHQNGQTFKVEKGQHNIIHSKGHSNTFKNHDLIGESFHIEVGPKIFYNIAKDGNDVLKQFLERMIKDEPVVLSPTSLIINTELHRAVQAILHCPYSGNMKKLFLLSKSIEILVMQAEAYDQFLKKENPMGTRKEDQERLIYARDYVEQHMSDPPSLSQLAKEIGINEYKLKKGFKELFGTTVFGYLSDYRLENARKVLIETDQPIGELAHALGYSSSQHFSSAFKNKYGISPKDCRKSG